MSVIEQNKGKSRKKTILVVMILSSLLRYQFHNEVSIQNQSYTIKTVDIALARSNPTLWG